MTVYRIDGLCCAWCGSSLCDHIIDGDIPVCNGCAALAKDVNAHKGEVVLSTFSYTPLPLGFTRHFRFDPPLRLVLSVAHDGRGYRWISGLPDEPDFIFKCLGTNQEPDADGGTVDQMINSVAEICGSLYCDYEDESKETSPDYQESSAERFAQISLRLKEVPA